MSKSAKDIMRDDVREVVDGVIGKFPGFISALLKSHTDKLVNGITSLSNKFVEAKIKEYMETQDE